jgi:hypothetical protein
MAIGKGRDKLLEKHELNVVCAGQVVTNTDGAAKMGKEQVSALSG